MLSLYPSFILGYPSLAPVPQADIEAMLQMAEDSIARAIGMDSLEIRTYTACDAIPLCPCDGKVCYIVDRWQPVSLVSLDTIPYTGTATYGPDRICIESSTTDVYPIVYTAGWTLATLPFGIRMAIGLLITQMVSQMYPALAGTNIKRWKQGLEEEEYFERNGNAYARPSISGLGSEIDVLLKPYIRMVSVNIGPDEGCNPTSQCCGGGCNPCNPG